MGLTKPLYPPKPSTRGSGWAYKGKLVGGQPGQGAKLLELSRKKKEQEDRKRRELAADEVEKEREKKREEGPSHSNALVMEQLLGAGGDHPPSQTSSQAVDARTDTENPDDQPPQPKQQKLDEGASSGLPGVTSQSPPPFPLVELSGVKQLLPLPTDTVTSENVKKWVENLPQEGVYDEMPSEANTSIDTVPPPAYYPSPQTQDRLKQVRVMVQNVKAPSEVGETPDLDMSDADSDDVSLGLRLRKLKYGVEVPAEVQQISVVGDDLSEAQLHADLNQDDQELNQVHTTLYCNHNEQLSQHYHFKVTSTNIPVVEPRRTAKEMFEELSVSGQDPSLQDPHLDPSILRSEVKQALQVEGPAGPSMSLQDVYTMSRVKGVGDKKSPPHYSRAKRMKNAVLCKHCIESTMHTCKTCGLRRCKMFHLNTGDDGETFECCVCNPAITGITGSKGYSRPPTKTELENSENKEDAEDIFGWKSDTDSDTPTEELGKEQQVQEKTPKRNTAAITKPTSLANVIADAIATAIGSPEVVHAIAKSRRNLDTNLGVEPEDAMNNMSLIASPRVEVAEDFEGDKDYVEGEDRGVELSKEEAVTFYEIPSENWVWVCKPGGETQFDPNAFTLYISPNPDLRNKATAVMFRVMAPTSMRLIFR